MKPTFQINRRARRGESQRPSAPSVRNAPATDWSYQSGAELRGGTTPAASLNEARPAQRGLYALTQGLYETQTKWEDRVESIGLCVVIGLASWPIMQAIYIAARTV
jgi:hypothetical protein